MAFSALVTGANRGIGLELTRRLITGPDPADYVFATCRNIGDCKVSLLHLLYCQLRVGRGHFRLRFGS